MTTLSGRVTVHGAPASGAVVELHNEGGDVVDQVQVDDDGSYRYHLAPGRWTVNVWDAHGHRARAAADLGDEDHTLDIDLHEPDGGH